MLIDDEVRRECYYGKQPQMKRNTTVLSSIATLLLSSGSANNLFGESVMFRRLIATSSTWVTLPIRLGLAAVMIAHGAQKVLGSFNGPGFKSFIAGNTPFGFMRPAWLWLGAAALSELVGGILVGIGFLTRVGAFFIGCTMLTAIAGVHWPGGFFASNRGYEYPLSLLAMAIALVIAGGGQASVDKGLSGRR
jgi:putative oxidoreductase